MGALLIGVVKIDSCLRQFDSDLFELDSDVRIIDPEVLDRVA